MSELGAPFTDADLTLEPLAERHRAGLRAACAADPDIWALYPVSYDPAHFERAFDALLARTDATTFAILHDGAVVGMTGYLGHVPARQTVEIGNSYIVPQVRGTGLNRRVKTLLLDRAFASGIRRVEFRVDERNVRSKAAVRKLGARQEGVLRAERVTWTRHVRDTALFSLLAEEWDGS